MQGFYWLVEGVLAGCARPGGGARRTGEESEGGPTARERLETDLAWLRARQITALLSLTETPLDPGAASRHGFVVLHLPVDDLTAPTPAQVSRALHFIDMQGALGERVAVHCLMGQGRTGTVLAAYLIRQGRSAEAAIERVRLVCPGAIGSATQERALHAFARRRDWIL